MKRFLTALPVILRDLAGVGGLVSVSYGAWLLSHPAGFIVGGVLLTAASFIAARAE